MSRSGESVVQPYIYAVLRPIVAVWDGNFQTYPTSPHSLRTLIPPNVLQVEDLLELWLDVCYSLSTERDRDVPVKVYAPRRGSLDRARLYFDRRARWILCLFESVTYKNVVSRGSSWIQVPAGSAGISFSRVAKIGKPTRCRVRGWTSTTQP